MTGADESDEVSTAPATLSPEGRGEHGARVATAKERSRHLTGGVARLIKD